MTLINRYFRCIGVIYVQMEAHLNVLLDFPNRQAERYFPHPDNAIVDANGMHYAAIITQHYDRALVKPYLDQLQAGLHLHEITESEYWQAFTDNPLPPLPDPEDEFPAWQPWDGNNANLYQIGDQVSHNGKNWVATVGNNNWEPGVFGWDEIT